MVILKTEEKSVAKNVISNKELLKARCLMTGLKGGEK